MLPVFSEYKRANCYDSTLQIFSSARARGHIDQDNNSKTKMNIYSVTQQQNLTQTHETTLGAGRES